jgi:hypothetical protein
MTANIKITSDESALGRLYLWLLSRNDETLAVDKQDIESKTELGIVAPALTLSDESVPRGDQA